jgi:hypothetical protein
MTSETSGVSGGERAAPEGASAEFRTEAWRRWLLDRAGRERTPQESLV